MVPSFCQKQPIANKCLELRTNERVPTVSLQSYHDPVLKHSQKNRNAHGNLLHAIVRARPKSLKREQGRLAKKMRLPCCYPMLY